MTLRITGSLRLAQPTSAKLQIIASESAVTLLLESGDALLLEDGSFLLLEP